MASSENLEIYPLTYKNNSLTINTFNLNDPKQRKMNHNKISASFFLLKKYNELYLIQPSIYTKGMIECKNLLNQHITSTYNEPLHLFLMNFNKNDSTKYLIPTTEIDYYNNNNPFYIYKGIKYSNIDSLIKNLPFSLKTNIIYQYKTTEVNQPLRAHKFYKKTLFLYFIKSGNSIDKLIIPIFRSKDFYPHSFIVNE